MAGPTILQSLRLLEQNKHFWEGWLSFQIQSAIDPSMDFAWLCYASATTLLIYASNKTNTFRLNGSLTTQMINKKCLNDVWCSAGKSLGRFDKFYKYDRPSINRCIINMHGREREIDWLRDYGSWHLLSCNRGRVFWSLVVWERISRNWPPYNLSLYYLRYYAFSE